MDDKRPITFSQWLMDAKPTEWLLSGVAIFSAIVTFWQYQVAKENLDIEREKIKVTIEKAAKNVAVDVETEISKQTDTLTGNKIGFVVQLASYRRENCDRAERAALRYEPGFEVVPKLYSSPSGQYIVVGLPASSKEIGNELVSQAISLSQTNQFKEEDFSNARLRENPDWKQIECKELN